MNRNSPIEPIILGKIGSSYGVRGWFRIFSFTEKIEDIFKYVPWFIQRKNLQSIVELEAQRHCNQKIIVKLKGVNDRNAASLLKNYEIVVDSSQLPPLKEGEYYWKDLIGCQVITMEGRSLGSVSNIIETGSNDVLVVNVSLKKNLNVRECLIPFLSGRVIKRVDLSSRKIEVDWCYNL